MALQCFQVSKFLSKGATLMFKEKVIETINKGYSSDKKVIVRRGNEKFIVRTFEGNQERREQEVALLKKLEELNANSLRVISLEEGKMVTSYIEGEDAEEAITKLPREAQYQIGVEASKDLRKIHLIQAPTNDWYERQSAKYRRYIERYQELPLKVQGDEQIMRFIEERLHLMKDRPNVLQHDDFHLPNLIVKDGKYAGVIDFGRFDWGDPIWDFIKLGMFSTEKSPPFAKGLIEGYYNGEPSKEFWELYALYLAMSVFSAIVWSQIQGEGDKLLKHVDRYIKDHKGFTQPVPVWYKSV